MKGFILSYFLITVLPATNMNCSKGEKPDSQLQTNNTSSTTNTNASGTLNKPLDAVTFKDQKGKIHIYVCTRGCYQYVLETELDGKKYKLSPDVLDEAFKKDKLGVIFSGTTTSEMIEIKKPAPNDVPIFDFKAPKILLESIKNE